MNVYIFRAALLCEPCGIAATNDPPTYDGDSNTTPQGPYPNGGGEADSPQHCDHCGLFLRNPLTTDGEAYVKETHADCPTAVTREWIDFYGLAPLPGGEADFPNLSPVQAGIVLCAHNNPRAVDNMKAGGLRNLLNKDRRAKEEYWPAGAARDFLNAATIANEGGGCGGSARDLLRVALALEAQCDAEWLAEVSGV